MAEKVAVLGGGGWGTALALVLAQKGYVVFLWVRRQAQAEEITREGENSRYLPGVKIPREVVVTTRLEEALAGAKLVVLSVPSHAVRGQVRQISPFLSPEQVLVNTAKGLEKHAHLRLSEVILQELSPDWKERLAVLSGPSHAEEVGRGFPTAVVVAAPRKKVAACVQRAFSTSFFRVYTNPDLTGVELGGALKNVIALATGMAEGLGFGDNTRAALVTRGLAEITRLGVALGGSPLTFAGLSGLGDLVVTCTSRYSRNRRAGFGLGKGKPLSVVLEEMGGMVVEGIPTTQAAWELAQKYGVSMPITAEVYKVLFEGQPPREGVGNLMLRVLTSEVEEERASCPLKL